jgi:hypothetical protein
MAKAHAKPAGKPELTVTSLQAAEAGSPLPAPCSLPVAPGDAEEELEVIDPRPPTNPVEPLDANGRRIHWYRQCPLCFHGLGGVGVAKCTRGKKRYYGCNCCGHSWVITFKFEVVKLEHRVVELSQQKEDS